MVLAKSLRSNRLRHMRRGEERVRSMERVTWKLTLPYVKYIAKGNLLYGSGALHQQGWDGKGDGREVQKGEDICIPMADSL